MAPAKWISLLRPPPRDILGSSDWTCAIPVTSRDVCPSLLPLQINCPCCLAVIDGARTVAPITRRPMWCNMRLNRKANTGHAFWSLVSGAPCRNDPIPSATSPGTSLKKREHADFCRANLRIYEYFMEPNNVDSILPVTSSQCEGDAPRWQTATVRAHDLHMHLISALAHYT